MHNFTLLQLLASVTGQREIFQAICSDIVRAENPGAHDIREDPGDDGIDVFVEKRPGVLDIYQAKFFPRRIDKSQRDQIKGSYSTVLSQGAAYGKVDTWTLMLPLRLSAEEFRWFFNWRKDKGPEIRLWSGEQLETKIRSPGYEEAYDRLSAALGIAGLALKERLPIRPLPLLSASFRIIRNGDPVFDMVTIDVAVQNVGEKSIRNPKVTIEYSKAALNPPEVPPWRRVQQGTLPGINPRTVEFAGTIRPSEKLNVLRIFYQLIGFSQCLIICSAFMDDESPVHTGLSISKANVNDEPEEKLGDENLFHDFSGEATMPNRLSPKAEDLVRRMREGSQVADKRGVIVTPRSPSSSMIGCTFNLDGGLSTPMPFEDFEEAVSELEQLGLIEHLRERSGNHSYYRLNDVL